MRQIITNISSKNPQTDITFNNRNTGLEKIRGVKEAELVIVREPDFTEIYNSFENQYQQFLTDTSDEIAKRAQKLSELKSFIYRNSPSG